MDSHGDIMEMPWPLTLPGAANSPDYPGGEAVEASGLGIQGALRFGGTTWNTGHGKWFLNRASGSLSSGQFQLIIGTLPSSCLQMFDLIMGLSPWWSWWFSFLSDELSMLVSSHWIGRLHGISDIAAAWRAGAPQFRHFIISIFDPTHWRQPGLWNWKGRWLDRRVFPNQISPANTVISLTSIHSEFAIATPSD